MALPLLPLQDVQRAYQELYEKIPVELEPLLEYFDGWWMKQVPLRLSNASDLVRLIIAWHSRFNKGIEEKHPNIWAFIKTLQNEEVHFQLPRIHANLSKLKQK
jgi:hypothetical protein